MNATYPKPATPLPWDSAGVNVNDPIPPETNLSAEDDAYIVRAANAFPHLVAALDEALPLLGGAEHEIVLNALAIARGEATP